MRVLAPRDLQAGGTWLGLNEHGLFVALTNRFGGPPAPDRRSRGMVVLDALGAPTADAAYAAARQLDPARENGFHLILADRTAAYWLCNDGSTLRHDRWAPGWHTVTERSFDAAPTAREPLIQSKLADLNAGNPPSDSDLRQLLSVRHDNGIDGVLVDVPTHNYGTRSSTIVRLAADGTSRFLHADGPPDRTPFVDASRLIPHA